MVCRNMNDLFEENLFGSISVNVFRFILVNVVYKLEMLVGNYIVLNMEYNLMDKCQLIVHLDRVMIHFKHFLLRQELENVRYSIKIHVENSSLLFD
jgi:predicted phosphatase